MRNVSYWASRHARLAIFLIILGEVANGFNGVLLGVTVLEHIPLSWLYAGMVLLISLACFVQLQARQTSASTNYWLSRKWLFTAFLTNYLLFSCLGGIWSHQVETKNSANAAFGNRRVIIVCDTLPIADSTRLKNQTTVQTTTSVSRQASDNTGLYIGLGVIGILLATYLTGLACGIACAGYGFGALLVFFMGLGSMAGSVYFFSRAGRKFHKRRRDMTTEERRRDSRRFWLPWVILIGLFSTVFLLTGIFS